MNASSRRALSIRELLVLIACFIVILAVVQVLFIRPGSPIARARARQLKDAAQMRAIHQSWIVFAREFDGVMPTPGLIKRKPDPILGDTPGRGPEDESLNTTANLYSACIAQNYFTPEMCVSPCEPSPHVEIMASEAYNWQAYQQGANINSYWDTNFKADLHGTSNVSYAHMPLIGERKLKRWRESLDPWGAIMGTRGPLNGVADPRSVTNKFFPPDDSWNGNILFADNHVEFTSSFFGNRASGATMAPRDNYFAWETLEMSDAMITFTKAIVDGKPVIEHD